MSTIIAACFEQQAQARHAIEELQQAGFAPDHVSTFYVNPPGQHSAYHWGGDHDKSHGAEDSPKGTFAGIATGGAIGAVLGATATPIFGLVGPAIGALLGAHVGSLIGSMNQMKDDGEEPGLEPPLRHAGVYVAVELFDAGMEEKGVDILRNCGASSVERAQGVIENGQWEEFDPSSSPDIILPSIQTTGGTSSTASVRRS